MHAVAVDPNKKPNEQGITLATRLLRPSTAIEATGRSTELPAAVTELLGILAEVAIDRAKAGAFELVAAQAREIVCDKLVWTPAFRRQLGLDPGLTCKPSSEVAPATDDTAACEPLLPRTCDAVKHLRMQELASSAEALYRDLVGDLTELGMTIVSQQLTRSPQQRKVIEAFNAPLQTVSKMIADAVIKRTAPTRRDAQLLVTELASIDWPAQLELSASSSEADWLFACGLDYGFAVVEECASSEGCAPSRVTDLLRSGTFDLETCNKHFQAPRDLSQWPELGKLALDALAVLDAAEREDGKEVFRNATSLIFNILDKRMCNTGGESRECKYVRGARDITVAVIDQKAQHVIVAASSLVSLVLEDALNDPHAQAEWPDLDPRRKALVKLTRVAGAVTAYATTYTVDAKGDTSKLKELHESRKKAIEGLIDGTTDRSDRGGDVVVSIGANVGFVAGKQYVIASGSEQAMYPQLSLPVGIAVQRLPSAGTTRAGTGLGQYIGIHGQASIVDLAQFLSYDEKGKLATPRPDTIAMLGLQLGVLLGKPSSAATIAFDLRYAPGILADGNTKTPAKEGAKAGAVRFGLTIGYYVPFFDFN
jgi:hypothetical protein